MKKILICIVFLFLLTGCSKIFEKENSKYYNNYLNFIELIESNDVFKNNSDFLDVSIESYKTNEGYRYYIFIDNPKIEMYEVKAVAIIENQDYTSNMAGNFGIFEAKTYNLIPNQVNSDSGYLKGFIISALSEKPEFKVKLIIQWKNFDLSIINQEFLEFKVKVES